MKEFILPDKWCVNREGQPEICKWFIEKVADPSNPNPSRPDFTKELRGPYTHWPMIVGTSSYTRGKCLDGYTLITVEQFYEYVLNPSRKSIQDLDYLAEMFKQLNIG